jgi:hypothetical protein
MWLNVSKPRVDPNIVCNSLAAPPITPANGVCGLHETQAD